MSYQQGLPQGMPGGGMPPYPQQPPSGAPYPGSQAFAPYPPQNTYPNAPYPPSSFNQQAPSAVQLSMGFGSTPCYMPMPAPMGSSMGDNSIGIPSPMGSSMGHSPYPLGQSSCPPPMGQSSYPPQMGQSPYASSGQSPYPSSGQSPYPSTGQSPYPSSGQSPYSSSGQLSYPPGQPSYPSPVGQSPYPSVSHSSSPMGQPSMPPRSVTGQHGSLYPSVSPVGQPGANYTTKNYGSLGSAPPIHGHSSPQAYKPKYSPTVLPATPFDPRADAETLRKAMKGFGTDEKAIIQVLANRTNQQRLEIGVQFKTLYGKDLVKDLKSETSGRFEDLLVAMMTPLPQFYAQEVHDALAGIGTDEDTLIEVFCTMNNHELRTIRAAYESMYRKSMEDDLIGDTSGTFRRLMVSLCTANRDESMNVDPSAAQRDAQELLRAGELRLGTDESTFNAVLCQRNFSHLQCVFHEYEKVTGHDFEQAIKNEFSGEEEEAFLAVVRSIKDRAQFFARRLHKSMKGMGTNDRQLIRLMVTRSEVDMGDIKNAYQTKYGETLVNAISSDCSGDYKKCLLALINI